MKRQKVDVENKHRDNCEDSQSLMSAGDKKSHIKHNSNRLKLVHTLQTNRTQHGRRSLTLQPLPFTQMTCDTLISP